MLKGIGKPVVIAAVVYLLMKKFVEPKLPASLKG